MEILNRKAYYNYEILETYEAGMVLLGTEIKSIRLGKANIKDSYGIIRNNEVILLNTSISTYKEGNQFNHDERRSRKLLLHKKEILKIKAYLEQDGYTLIPLKIYFLKAMAKVLLGVAKGKNLYDKKETIKKRDIERENQYNYKFK